QVMYYSHHFGNAIFIKQREFSDLNILQNGNWKKYDYLAIRLNKKTLAEKAALLNEIGKKPIMVFKGQHSDDQVRIYQGQVGVSQDQAEIYQNQIRIYQNQVGIHRGNQQ